MGTTLRWLDDRHSILYLQFQGEWTMEEFKSAIARGNIMVRTVDWPVYVIADYLESAVPPFGIVWEFRRAARLVAPNLVMVISITNSDLIRSVVSAVTALYRERKIDLKVVKTLPDAMKIILAHTASSQSGSQVTNGNG